MRRRKRRRLKPFQQGELMDQISIASIIVENRFRKDMGNLDALAESIAELGQLQPIIINKDRRLIAGGRRLEAMKLLGRELIAASVFDLDDLDALKVERDENDQRKEPTTSEKVALAQAIAEREKENAKHRQGQRTDLEPVGNISQMSETGRVSDILAQKVGLGSGKTLEAAQKVVERGIPELVEAMDRGRVTIHAAKNIASLPDDEVRGLDFDNRQAVKNASQKAEARARRAREKSASPQPVAPIQRPQPSPPKADESRLYEEGSSVSAWVLAHQAKHAIRQISKNDPNALAAIESVRVVLEKQLQVITEGNRQ